MPWRRSADRSTSNRVAATGNAPANFTIKHMAHNPLRRAPGKDPLRLRRKVAAWDDDFLARIVPHGVV